MGSTSDSEEIWRRDARPLVELAARVARPAVHVLAGEHGCVSGVVQCHRERRPGQQDLVLVDAGVVLVEPGDDLARDGQQSDVFTYARSATM